MTSAAAVGGTPKRRWQTAPSTYAPRKRRKRGLSSADDVNGDDDLGAPLLGVLLSSLAILSSQSDVGGCDALVVPQGLSQRENDERFRRRFGDAGGGVLVYLLVSTKSDDDSSEEQSNGSGGNAEEDEEDEDLYSSKRVRRYLAECARGDRGMTAGQTGLYSQKPPIPSVLVIAVEDLTQERRSVLFGDERGSDGRVTRRSNPHINGFFAKMLNPHNCENRQDCEAEEHVRNLYLCFFPVRDGRTRQSIEGAFREEYSAQVDAVKASNNLSDSGGFHQSLKEKFKSVLTKAVNKRRHATAP